VLKLVSGEHSGTTLWVGVVEAVIRLRGKTIDASYGGVGHPWELAKKKRGEAVLYH